jgi:hypothetical protein
MGTPKGNLKGFRYRDSGGTSVQTGAAAFTITGNDAKNDQVRVWGRFAIDAVTQTPVNIIGKGIASITGGAGAVGAPTGIYTVTFTQGFQTLQSGHAFAMPEASGVGTDDIAQLGTFTAGAAGACTLVIFNFTGAAAADPAAGDYIGFDVVLTSQWLD